MCNRRPSYRRACRRLPGSIPPFVGHRVTRLAFAIGVARVTVRELLAKPGAHAHAFLAVSAVGATSPTRGGRDVAREGPASRISDRGALDRVAVSAPALLAVRAGFVIAASGPFDTGDPVRLWVALAFLVRAAVLIGLAADTSSPIGVDIAASTTSTGLGGPRGDPWSTRPCFATCGFACAGLSLCMIRICMR
jgi:hypothetical protein